MSGFYRKLTPKARVIEWYRKIRDENPEQLDLLYLSQMLEADSKAGVFIIYCRSRREGERGFAFAGDLIEIKNAGRVGRRAFDWFEVQQVNSGFLNVALYKIIGARFQ